MFLKIVLPCSWLIARTIRLWNIAIPNCSILLWQAAKYLIAIYSIKRVGMALGQQNTRERLNAGNGKQSFWNGLQRLIWIIQTIKIREFGWRIKFRWSGGGEKMGKRLVWGLGWAENKKKWLSEASDEQEIGKNSFPRPRTSRKQEKLAFRGLGWAENSKKWLSETSDEQKTEKIDFRPWPKLKKRLKQAFQALGWAENWKNRLSNPLDEQKTEKIGFPTPWMSRKLKKLAFQPLGSGKIDA